MRKDKIINNLSIRCRLKNKTIEDLTRTNIILSLKILRLQKEIEYLKLHKR